MDNKKVILITNDDGIEAEGIRALIKGLEGLGNIFVVAPDIPRSGMSNAITSTTPIKVSLLHHENDLTVYSCSGTPTDCVKVAINEILDVKPDLLVSGINHGGNQAICVHYSGTMGAAIEGCIFGVSSIGISLYNYTSGAPFKECVRIGRNVCKLILEKGLSRGTYLNLNIPNIPQVQGLAVSRQADGQWVNEYSCTKDSDGTPLYWLGGEFVNQLPIHPENDTQRLNAGYASLVPCHIDVTDYEFMKTLKDWFV